MWHTKPTSASVVSQNMTHNYISSKFSGNLDFDNREINRKVFQDISSNTDKRKYPTKPEILILLNYYRLQNWNSNGKFVVYETEPWFTTVESSRVCRQVIATTIDSRKQRHCCRNRKSPELWQLEIPTTTTLKFSTMTNLVKMSEVISTDTRKFKW